MAHAAMSPPVLPLWIAVEKDFFVRDPLCQYTNIDETLTRQ